MSLKALIIISTLALFFIYLSVIDSRDSETYSHISLFFLGLGFVFQFKYLLENRTSQKYNKDEFYPVSTIVIGLITGILFSYFLYYVSYIEDLNLWFIPFIIFIEIIISSIVTFYGIISTILSIIPTSQNKEMESNASKPQRTLVIKNEDNEDKESKTITEQKTTIFSKSVSFNYMPKPNSFNGKNVLSMNRKDNGVDLKSAFTYKGATIQYKIKVENQTSEPIADIKINLYVPDVFILSESTKSITIIKPSESKTVTFDIRPTGECGDCQISGKVVYYDYKTKKTTEATIPTKNVSIICPMLKSKEISESEWRNTISALRKAEETTKEIDMDASLLFDITSDVLQDMNLFMLDPKVNDSGNLCRTVSKFYGEGVKSLKYAAQIEVVGGPSKSKLILKAWAESEDALTGFYHGILDEIEKRVHVKNLIDTTVVNNYHYGDNIGTQVKDSVVQRSTIGTNKDKCNGSEMEYIHDDKLCTSYEKSID